MLQDFRRNPFTEYAYFVRNRARNRKRFENLTQMHMALVHESELEPNVTLYERAVVAKSRIGSFSYIGERTLVARTTMGRFCSIGPDCKMGLGRHPTRGFVSTHPMFYSTRKQAGVTLVDVDRYEENAPTVVGHDVWMGAHVVIADGVAIGNGAVIGAGAVVARDVEPYAIVGGVPARVLRHRFDSETVELLQRFKWWNRDLSWLRQNAALFADVEAFKRVARESL